MNLCYDWQNLEDLGNPFASIWHLKLSILDAKVIPTAFAEALPHVFPGLYWLTLDAPKLMRVPYIEFSGSNSYFQSGSSTAVDKCIGLTPGRHHKISVTLLSVRKLCKPAFVLYLMQAPGHHKLRHVVPVPTVVAFSCG